LFEHLGRGKVHHSPNPSDPLPIDRFDEPRLKVNFVLYAEVHAQLTETNTRNSLRSSAGLRSPGLARVAMGARCLARVAMGARRTWTISRCTIDEEDASVSCFEVHSRPAASHCFFMSCAMPNSAEPSTIAGVTHPSILM
jgi:hypothetical protein